MKVIVIGLAVLFAALQIKLWAGSGGVRDIARLSEAVGAQREQNAALAERNGALAAEVQDLKQGNAAVEERARAELGMVRQDETFFQVITR
jgi:cell division protein FtsB